MGSHLTNIILFLKKQKTKKKRFITEVICYVQDMQDEWGMGMNGDQISPIHPNEDEWIGWGYYS